MTYRLFGVKEIRNAILNIKHLRKAKRLKPAGRLHVKPAIIVAEVHHEINTKP